MLIKKEVDALEHPLPFLFLLLLGYGTLVSVAIASIDWGRWHMLYMTVVLEGTVLILAFDVTIDEFHEQVLIQ